MGTLRSILEQTTKGFSYKRKMPDVAGGGPIFVSTAGGLKYLFRSMNDIDPSLLNLARDYVKPGDVVWDIGANIGLFSFAAAYFSQAKGQVISFEPDAWLIQLLRRSCSLQNSATTAPVQIVPVAVAETCDLRTFNIANRSRATNFLEGYGHSQTGGVSEKQTVMCVSLDWLADRLSTPHVVKIDVEGAEIEVLKGGTQLFAKAKPIIICEVAEANGAAVFELLDSSGYDIYDGDVDANRRVKVDTAPWSTVAIPRP